MSMASALNNAVTGLTATSRMAEVVSSNLSNALTDGYGRRSVDLSSVQVGNRGGGVRVDAVTRHVDAGILADRRLADAAMSGEERKADATVRLEQIVGTADDPAGLGARLAAFESALISASSDPASDLRLSSAVSRLQDIARTLQTDTKSIQSLRVEADRSIASDVDTLNASLQQVQALNSDILRVQGSGGDISAVLDARQRAVDTIAQIVPVRQIERTNGTIALMTTSGGSLLDLQPTMFAFEPTPTVTPDMTMSSGALGVLTVNGEAAGSATGVGRYDGGSLGAAFELRDQTLPTAQNSLDEIAADLVARFQDTANDPSLVSGDLGLLTDAGAPVDPTDIVGLAGRIAVNVNLVSSNGENLLRDGLNATATGPTGDSTQLDRWIAALGTFRSDVPGTTSQTAAGRIASVGAKIGTLRLAAQQDQSFATARWETLRQEELANGVDTDVELQKLLQIEKAYAANAKVIQTVDLMMQKLMEI